MSQLYDVIARIYARQVSYKEVSPVTLAREAMVAIDFPTRLHTLGYEAADMHFRHIARAFCRKHFEPEIRAKEEGDLFGEMLQERYPVRTRPGEEPRYVLLEHLSDDDRAYNIQKLERFSRATQKHADALRADGERRKRGRAA